MKFKVIFPLLIVLVVFSRSNEGNEGKDWIETGRDWIDTGKDWIETGKKWIETGKSIYNGATKVVGFIKKAKGVLNIFKRTKQNSEASPDILNTMNSLHEQQMKQNDENYMNTMLKLNGIEGKFDAVSSQVTDMQGKLVDISGMLDGMDGKLNTITDLVFNIDGKMDKFSNQVR
jgi:hypothetical protein